MNLLNIFRGKKQIESVDKPLTVKEEYIQAEEKLGYIIKQQYFEANGKKNEFKIANPSKLDLKYQIKKAKSFLDLTLIPAIYFTESGRVIVVPVTVYTTCLGTYCKFYDGVNEIKKEVRHVVEFEYIPSGERQVGVIIDYYTPISLKITRNLNKEIKKQCEDLNDTMVMIEKHFLAKVLTDIWSENKYTFVAIFGIGAVMGFAIAKIMG